MVCTDGMLFNVFQVLMYAKTVNILYVPIILNDFELLILLLLTLGYFY